MRDRTAITPLAIGSTTGFVSTVDSPERRLLQLARLLQTWLLQLRAEARVRATRPRLCVAALYWLSTEKCPQRVTGA
jgi:hypothetical protein